FFFFSSRRRHTRWPRDWSSDVCSSDLDRILRQRLADLGLKFESVLTEFVGADATHGPLARASAPLDQLPEVQLRIGVRSPDRAEIGRASCRERGEGWVVGGGVKERMDG